MEKDGSYMATGVHAVGVIFGAPMKCGIHLVSATMSSPEVVSNNY